MHVTGQWDGFIDYSNAYLMFLGQITASCKATIMNLTKFIVSLDSRLYEIKC